MNNETMNKLENVENTQVESPSHSVETRKDSENSESKKTRNTRVLKPLFMVTERLRMLWGMSVVVSSVTR